MIDAANLRRCFEWKLLIAQNRQVSWLADLHLSGLLTASRNGIFGSAPAHSDLIAQAFT